MSQASLSTAVLLRVLIIAVVVGVTLWLLWHVILLAFFSTLFAVLLRGAASRIGRLLHLSTQMTMAFIVIGLVAVMAGAIYWAGPSIAGQSRQLFESVVTEAKALQRRYGGSSIDHWLTSHLLKAGSSDQPELTAADTTLDLLVDAVVLGITTLYLASAPELYVNGIVRLLPLSYRDRGRDILLQSGDTLWRWLIGQGVDMLVVGVLATTGFLIVGVPLPFLLGFITGMLTFIPYFGPFLSAIPAVLSGLTAGVPTAAYALGVLLVCHLAEGYVVAPLVQRRMVNLPPALTILSLGLFGTLFGPMGAILGTPLAAVLLVIVQQAYVVDTLGDVDLRKH